MQSVAPLGADTTLDCATVQLKSLSYTIVAGDSEIGFFRGEKYLPTSESWFLPGNGERDVLTAMVFADPATGASPRFGRQRYPLAGGRDTGSVGHGRHGSERHRPRAQPLGLGRSAIGAAASVRRSRPRRAEKIRFVPVHIMGGRALS